MVTSIVKAHDFACRWLPIRLAQLSYANDQGAAGKHRARLKPWLDIQCDLVKGEFALLRRLYVTLTLGILMTAALAQGAGADPVNAKNAFTFTTTCDGQQLEFVVMGNGDFTPAHVVGSTTIFIPEVFDLTFTFTPPGGPTETETFTAAKANPQGDVTCSIDISETTPEGTFSAVGTVTGFFTPPS